MNRLGVVVTVFIVVCNFCYGTGAPRLSRDYLLKSKDAPASELSVKNDSFNNVSFGRSFTRTQFKEDSGDEHEDEDDDEKATEVLGMSMSAFIGFVIAVIALTIAVPTLLAFCCETWCFAPKKPILVHPIGNQHHQAAEDRRVSAGQSRSGSEPAVPVIVYAVAATAPGYVSNVKRSSKDDHFYLEPPPPYNYNVDHHYDMSRRFSQATSQRSSMSDIGHQKS